MRGHCWRAVLLFSAKPVARQIEGCWTTDAEVGPQHGPDDVELFCVLLTEGESHGVRDPGEGFVHRPAAGSRRFVGRSDHKRRQSWCGSNDRVAEPTSELVTGT